MPQHGTRFHTGFPDSFENHNERDPRGLRIEDLLASIKAKNINYFFGRITPHTDKMIQVLWTSSWIKVSKGSAVKQVDQTRDFLTIPRTYTTFLPIDGVASIAVLFLLILHRHARSHEWSCLGPFSYHRMLRGRKKPDEYCMILLPLVHHWQKYPTGGNRTLCSMWVGLLHCLSA